MQPSCALLANFHSVDKLMVVLALKAGIGEGEVKDSVALDAAGIVAVRQPTTRTQVWFKL